MRFNEILAGRIIPDHIVEKYMGGDCWSLAIAHHRRFGWPIYCLGGYEDENQRDDWHTISFYHVMVKHPTGVALDIQGPHEVQAVLDEWGDVEFLPLTESQLFSLFRDQRRAPKADAITAAASVIDRYLIPAYPVIYV